MSSSFSSESWKMRQPCPKCGGTEGVIETQSGQDRVFCLCGAWVYNAPKTETGRAVRSVTTVHNGIKPKLRMRIIERANGHCELCGAKDNLHVGHMISVDAGLKAGMTDAEINSDENLYCSCDECNLGLGKTPIPLRLAVALVMARLKNQGALGEQ